MSTEVAVSWLSYDDLNPAKGRWDQLHLQRFLNGDEGRPPGGYTFVETEWDPTDGEGRVVVFPCGFYHDHGTAHVVMSALVADLRKMPWAVLIATSDECSTFPWHTFEPMDNVTLYVMTPRPEHDYPSGARFIGEGSPESSREISEGAALTRDLDMFFSGQGGHRRRDESLKAMRDFEGAGRRCKIVRTPAFLTDATGDVLSAPGSDLAYVHGLTRAWIAPAPSGLCTQDSFRLFEALEAGCIPIADERRPDGGGDGYWRMLDMEGVLPRVREWHELPHTATSWLIHRSFNAAHIGSAWQQYKRRFIARLNDDVQSHVGQRDSESPHDLITVVIPTSPVSSNPDLSMIQQTIESIRVELPEAEILICADGVRPEQARLEADYSVFLHRLAIWSNVQFNVWLFTSPEHRHQSGMMRAILPKIHTPYMLFVEHDCPLTGTIPFADCITTMDKRELNMMRFSHEHEVLDVHEYLFLETHPDDPAPWRETIQYSARPHLAKTDWYRWVINTYFGHESRTFIEDLLYGTLIAGPDGAGTPFADRLRVAETWNWSRMALYHPEGNIRRSAHLDGRAGEPKYDVVWAYDSDRPRGAPEPGRYPA